MKEFKLNGRRVFSLKNKTDAKGYQTVIVPFSELEMRANRKGNRAHVQTVKRSKLVEVENEKLFKL